MKTLSWLKDYEIDRLFYKEYLNLKDLNMFEIDNSYPQDSK